MSSPPLLWVQHQRVGGCALNGPLRFRENTLHALKMRRKSGAALTVPLVTELVRLPPAEMNRFGLESPSPTGNCLCSGPRRAAPAAAPPGGPGQGGRRPAAEEPVHPDPGGDDRRGKPRVLHPRTTTGTKKQGFHGKYYEQA